jgi:hypothetical protein
MHLKIVVLIIRSVLNIASATLVTEVPFLPYGNCLELKSCNNLLISFLTVSNGLHMSNDF